MKQALPRLHHPVRRPEMEMRIELSRKMKMVKKEVKPQS